MMYTTEKPIEKRGIKTFYAIPGVPKISHMPKGRPGGRKKENFITIDVKWGSVYFYSMAKDILGIEQNDRFGFTWLGAFLYVHKCRQGNKITSRKGGCYYEMRHRPVVHELREKFGIRKTIRCELRKSTAKFDDQPMYEVIIPKYFRSLYRIRAI